MLGGDAEPAEINKYCVYLTKVNDKIPFNFHYEIHMVHL